MQDGEDLVNFIEEQREKIAYDRGRLKNNPASLIANNTVNRQILNLDKENRIPDYETVGALLSRSENHDALPIQTTTRPPATPRILRLGDDYKRKQEKLKEELRADYRNAMAEKNLRTSGNRQLQNTEIPLGKKTNSDLGVSLPLKDRLSAKIKDASTETYEELLERKRKQEKSYRGISDDNDDIRERTRRRDADREGGVGHFSQKRVRFPSKDRRSHGRNDDFLGDEEIDDHACRSRRGRTRVSPGRRERRCSSEEDSEYDSEEDRTPRRRKKNVSMERRRPAPSFENEPTTGSLPASKQKSESDDHRSKAAPNDPKFTGLSIGQVPSANTVQQRKEEYRTQLLQQMEENKKQKKKERELDKRADAISFNEQFDKNNNNIEDKNVSPPKRRATPSPPPENADPRQRKQKKKTTRKVQLDLSSEEEEGVSPRRGFHRGPHPSQSYFAPPLQPSTGYYPPQYANPYNDPYYYYGTRNPLDPGATSLPPPQPGGYPGVLSPVMAAAYATGRADRNESPDRDRNAPAGRRPNKNESSSQIADENKEQEKKKQQTILYQEELNDQIAQKQKEKQNAKKEQQRYDMNIENEARNYNPWGKGGGGAPMKDRQGNLISDLRNMHLENEEAGKDPEKAQKVVRERLPQTNLHQREEKPVIDPSPRNAPAGDEDMISMRFGRSNPFEAKQSDVQKTQRDVYKEFLQKQIEEKHRLEAEKRERDRLEEEKEERRFEEQRKKIQAELEAELDKDRKKKEMAERQNEEIRIQAEDRKKEEQRKKMEEEDEQRRNREQELDKKLRGMTKSPAIPTLRNQQQQQTLGSPPGHEPPLRTREETTVATQPPQKQPVAHAPRIQTYRTESPRQYEGRPPTQSRNESERISRELSTLRKQLLSEQRRVEDELHTVDLSKTPTRKINTEYIVDLSRAKQKPVAVRRPPTVENERPSSRALREFSDYKHSIFQMNRSVQDLFCVLLGGSKFIFSITFFIFSSSFTIHIFSSHFLPRSFSVSLFHPVLFFSFFSLP